MTDTSAHSEVFLSGNRLVAVACALFVVVMLGASYAAVPLYELFCRVTGYGGTTQQVALNPGIILDKQMDIRFDANLGNSALSEFRPLQNVVTTRIGETQTIFYRARNDTNEDIWVTASFNVSPDIAGSYFNKIECFCFLEQKIAANSHVDLPVQFFIDPEIVKDKNFKGLSSITLSYSFFAIDAPDNDGEKTKL